jgi:hypothetical protein
MRTTVTLDPDTRRLVEKAMRERGISFKDAVNEAIRAGLQPRSNKKVSYTTPMDLGRERVDLTKALQIASAMEDEEILRRMAEGR